MLVAIIAVIGWLGFEYMMGYLIYSQIKSFFSKKKNIKKLPPVDDKFNELFMIKNIEKREKLRNFFNVLKTFGLFEGDLLNDIYLENSPLIIFRKGLGSFFTFLFVIFLFLMELLSIFGLFIIIIEMKIYGM